MAAAVDVEPDEQMDKGTGQGDSRLDLPPLGALSSLEQPASSRALVLLRFLPFPSPQ